MIGLGQHMYDKGAFNQQLHDIKSNMAFHGVSLEQAMDGLSIRKEDRDFFRKAILDKSLDNE